MTYYFIAYDHFLNMHLPSLHTHFDSIDVRPDLYLIEWYEILRSCLHQTCVFLQDLHNVRQVAAT